MIISNAFKERRKCGELRSAVFLLGSGEQAHIFPGVTVIYRTSQLNYLNLVLLVFFFFFTLE